MAKDRSGGRQFPGGGSAATTPAAKSQADRQERLAASLRTNLGRRKDQARARGEKAPPSGDDKD